MIKKTQTKRTDWSVSQLEKYIRTESLVTGRVVFLDHARQQMKKRAITMNMVLETLRRGKINITPELEYSSGDLKCRMEYFVAGHNTKVVVAISNDNPNIVLVTAI